MYDSEGRKKIQFLFNSKIKKQFWENKISMGKSLLIKIATGKSSNEVSNCPFASPGSATVRVISLTKQEAIFNE